MTRPKKKSPEPSAVLSGRSFGAKVDGAGRALSRGSGQESMVAQLFRHHMNTFLKKAFLEEPKQLGVGYRYGFLALILALFLLAAFDSPRHFWGGLPLPIMLLFNHLAFQFRWSRPVKIILRAFAYFWIVLIFVVMFYDISKWF